MSMTLEEITKKVEGQETILKNQEVVLKNQETVLKSLTADNDVLKAENEAVMKMTKKERKLYSSMDDTLRKEYVAGDESKRQSMMDVAAQTHLEKKMMDEMDEVTKAEFITAGPEKRKAIIAKIEEVHNDILAKNAEEIRKATEVLKKAKMQAPPPADEEGSDKEEASESADEEDKEDMKKAHTQLALKVAETTDRLVKNERELETLRKRDRLVQFTKRAEAELPHTSGSPEEKGSLLMSLADSLPGGEAGNVFKQTFDNLKAADKALSLHFGEVGKAGGPIPAEKALDAKVEEICKRDHLDKAHGMMKAMQEAPELYLDYERQHRQYAIQQ